MIDKSDMLAGLFVVMITPSFVRWIKSAMMSDLVFFKHLLMLVMLELAELMINSVFDLAMEIIICFLNGPLVVMLIMGFFCLSLLFMTLMILPTSSADNSGKVSLMQRMSLTLGEMLAFEACIYDVMIDASLLRLMPPGDSIDMGKRYDNMIGCATCRRCCYLALSLWSPHVLTLMYVALLNYGLV